MVNMALLANNYGAAVRAEEDRCKVAGLMSDGPKLLPEQRATDDDLITSLARQLLALGVTTDEHQIRAMLAKPVIDNEG